MNEFLMKASSLIMLSVEILAAVTGLLLFNKYKLTTAKYFIFFLVYVVIIASIARYSFFVYDDGPLSFLEGTLIERNYWWYTVFWNIGGVLFYSWYYLKILRNNVYAKFLRVSVLVFILISFSTIFLTLPDIFKKSIPIISIVGGLIILECVFFYFLEILQNDKVLNFYKSLNFYVSCVILIFWLIKTPLVFYEQFLTRADWDYIHLRSIINIFAVCFMYLTYTFALIWCEPEKD